MIFGRAQKELQKPPISQEVGSFEILRVWCGENLPQQYALNTTWDDPGAWGLVLADIARHVAKAYGSSSEIPEREAFLRIKQLLDVEWCSPTDKPEQLL